MWIIDKGGNLYWRDCKTNLVLTGTEMLYKRFEITSSENSLIGFHKGRGREATTFPNRQHSSTETSTRNGGNQEHKFYRVKQGIWEYLLLKGITTTAKYLRSMMNTEADGVSRQEKDRSWKLKLQIFSKHLQNTQTTWLCYSN